MCCAHTHYVTNRFRFCRTNCNCQLKSAKHFLINGQCANCDAFKVKFINEMDHCFICFENKYLIETECKHRFCLNCLLCLLKLNGDKDADDNPCPMCCKNIDSTY
jgi:hypothetical protein